jgi:hypothetical protein
LPTVQRLAGAHGAAPGPRPGAPADGARLVLDTVPTPASPDEPVWPAATVQRQDAPAASPPAASPVTETTPAVGGQAPAPGGAVAAAAPNPEQLEDLARRLVAPLARRLKAEMLLDRERRGLRTDAR